MLTNILNAKNCHKFRKKFVLYVIPLLYNNSYNNVLCAMKIWLPSGSFCHHTTSRTRTVGSPKFSRSIFLDSIYTSETETREKKSYFSTTFCTGTVKNIISRFVVWKFYRKYLLIKRNDVNNTTFRTIYFQTWFIQRRRDCLFSIRLFYGIAHSDGLIETWNLVFSRHILTVHLSRHNNIPELG